MALRFIVTVSRDWDIAVTCPDLADWKPQTDGPAALGRLDDGRGGYIPAPRFVLHQPDTDHRTLAPAADAADLMALYDAVRTRRATPAELATFGHYLFDVLLDNDRWAELLQLTEQHRELELALALPPEDMFLGRLNWELLRSDAGFIAAGAHGVRVAITRLVVPHHPTVPQQLDVPPRALFVIGTSLLDRDIRPAAELHTLLKLARDGRAMRYRVLERAKPSAIRKAIKDFQPEIVHYIAHGGVDPETGRVYLELNTDDDDAEPKRYAEQILSDLRQADKPATIVVLSACLTGGAPGAERLFGVHEAAPLAAALVDGGIPIVVGMAGQVADITSRLFARTFGESLMHGRPLVMATADARATAFADPADPMSTIDWALPAVFVSSLVPTGFRPLDGEATAALWRQIEGWIRAYDGGHKPVFCGREAFLPMFHNLFGPDATKFGLAVYTAGENTSGTGRTRLLRELAAHALRDGHLPILISLERKTPLTPDELGRAFVRELSRVRVDVLEIGEAYSSQLRLLNTVGRDGLHRDVAGALDGDTVTVRAVGRALRIDLAELRKDARTQLPYFAKSAGQVVVLLDDIDRFAEMVDDVLGDHGLFTVHGLGTAADPVPVVLTWTLGRTGDPWLNRLVPGQQAQPLLEVAELRPFTAGDAEDLLAYQTVLLNPFQPATAPQTNVLTQAWVFNARTSGDALGRCYADLRRTVNGIPRNFHLEDFEAWARVAADDGVLVVARDEDRMAKMVGGR
ncbi:CHAT domain-containing protein [Kribbella monticola]|uniref:CHAT domain-containing protein n=1 Tax=Kribbella monticola TaxID=2185285 RepID=UPI000DD2D28D|nr:CHAT domain-containing protein [Kribbella monticola]